VSALLTAHETAGSSLPLPEMPGFISDAIRIATYETKAQEAAMDEAVNNG
jgi:hypothetical protein